MKQLIQHLDSGQIEHIDVPSPNPPPHHLKIDVTYSVISPGTERMLLSFGRASLVEKAIQKPDKVKQAIDKVGTDGVMATAQAIYSKLKQPITLGYASVGIVTQVGEGVTDFKVGDRVASNGPHAQQVIVPKLLCARVPEHVADEDAAMTTLGAIALQGIREANPTLGERFVVMGLGTIGALTTTCLLANGCDVFGVDLQDGAIEQSKSLGLIHHINPKREPNWMEHIQQWSNTIDGVIICASSQDPAIFEQAAQLCRPGGRIVLVGVAPIELDRNLFYQKSLSFHVSSAYGPGRNDANYEKYGQDYPIAHVRWTAQRNMEAFLTFLTKHPNIAQTLCAQRVDFMDATNAYDALLDNDSGTSLLCYKQPAQHAKTIHMTQTTQTTHNIRCGIIGAGNYARRVFLPLLAKHDVTLSAIASQQGLSASIAARTFGIAQATTNVDELLKNESINTLFILTQHNNHADLVVHALNAGKHVFVEKPLAITSTQLEAIEIARKKQTDTILMVGFNRRFAPVTQALARALQGTGHKQLHMTFNAGALPTDHWTRQHEHGGRLVGEACHAIDLLTFLVDAPVVNFDVAAPNPMDRGQALMTFADGSIASIMYTDLGHASFPKERLDVFANGTTWQIDNFKTLHCWQSKPTFNRPGWSVLQQDKGHEACLTAFIDAVQGRGEQPIKDQTLFDVTRLCLHFVEP